MKRLRHFTCRAILRALHQVNHEDIYPINAHRHKASSNASLIQAGGFDNGVVSDPRVNIRTLSQRAIMLVAAFSHTASFYWVQKHLSCGSIHVSRVSGSTMPAARYALPRPRCTAPWPTNGTLRAASVVMHCCA